MNTKVNRLRENAIESVMRKTGWDREETIEKIEDAKMRTGIRYTEYNKYNFHEIPVEQQGITFREILEKQAERKRRQERANAQYLVKIMAETGWDFEYADERVQEANARTGCTYKEFTNYRFWELDEQTQEELYLISSAKKIIKKFDVDPDFIDLIRDKARTNEKFSEYLKREWCLNTEITKEEFVEKFSNSKKIIYKPNGGMQGTGVEVFEITPESAEDVFEQLILMPKGVVEEYVIQHPEMNTLNPTSVNTMRIVTLSSMTEPVTPDGKSVVVAYVSLRTGGGGAIVDNYSSGGMMMGVDVETGCVITNSFSPSGEVISVHPATGVTFKGFKIPYFKEALEMVTGACEKYQLSAYIGWDIAIGEDGPVLIEVNQKPGSAGLTAPWLSEKRGMKQLMEQYL